LSHKCKDLGTVGQTPLRTSAPSTTAIIGLLVLNAAIDVIEAPMRVSAYPRSELAGTAGLKFLDAKWAVCKNQN